MNKEIEYQLVKAENGKYEFKKIKQYEESRYEIK